MRGKSVGVVVIGRNEGARLRRCLESVGEASGRVYVDSGSIDGSQSLAANLGFDVVELDLATPFTAARARNAGILRLLQSESPPEFIQFVDGDCELHPDWIGNALADIDRDPMIAAVCGRRRERYPLRNIYHAASDHEWAMPIGFVPSCGGDALFRTDALRDVNLYNPALIAGEEPDLCLRLRAKNWKIYSNGREMTAHDVDISSLGQWLKRGKRTGFAMADLIHLHGFRAEPGWDHILRSSVIWSCIIGLALVTLVIGAILGSAPLLLLSLAFWMLIAAQIVRTALRHRSAFRDLRSALAWSLLLLASKPSQLSGVLSYSKKRLRGRTATLIEYK